MSHKTLVRVAIIMIVVFGFIVIVYPRLYHPETATPIAPAPVPAGP